MFSKFYQGLIILVTILASGCSEAPVDEAAKTQKPNENVLILKAVGLTFEGKNEIPSGWVTIKFQNLSPMIHLALIEKLPDGVSAKDLSNDVIAIFQKSLDLSAAGDIEGSTKVFEDLPEWFGGLVFYGGPGLLSAGGESEVTVYLEPGIYVIECYIKSNGILHNYSPDPETLGMIHELVVSNEKGEGVEPAFDVELEISSNGYEILSGSFSPGRNTVKTTFADQKVYPTLVGHDAHVVRLEEGLDVDALMHWVNFANADGQVTPSPYQFVGGTQDMPAGSITYFTVDIEAGQYAIIGEIPDAKASGHYLEFEVK